MAIKPIASIVVLFMLITFLFPVPGYCQKRNTILRISNKLGVTVDVPVPRYTPVSFGNSLAEQLCPSDHLLMELETRIYVSIPLKSFLSAVMENKEQVVSLANGKTLRGMLLGTLKSDDSSQRIYELKNATAIKMVSYASSPYSYPSSYSYTYTSKTKTGDSWLLNVQSPRPVSYKIVSPQFGFSYYFSSSTTSSYKSYSSKYYTKKTLNFIIKVDREEITANIPDFREIILKNAVSPAVTLISDSGVRTNGLLILKEGYRSARNWLIMGELDGYNGTTVYVVEPTCTLKKTM